MPGQKTIINELYRALLAVDRCAATEILTQTTSNLTPLQRIEGVVAPVLKQIGEEWERGNVSLSQVYMSGLICEDIVGPLLSKQASSKRNQPPLAIVTLEDHHPLGKKTVSSLIISAGYDLTDYGQGVTVDDLVPMLKRDGIRILLISTLMLRSALQVRALIDKIKEEGLDIRIIVGGAPFLFDDILWKDVGADAMARTASEALEILERMVGETG